MSDYLISKETLTELGNAVRTLSGETGTMSPTQMTMKVNETKGAINALEEHKIDSTAHSNLLQLINKGEIANEYVWSKSAEYDADVIQRASSTTTVKITSVDSGMTVYKTATLVDGKIVLSNSEKVDYNRGSDRYLSKSGVTYLLVSLDSYANSAATYIAYVMSVGKETRQGIIGYVNSSDPNAYPVDDGYTYTALGQLGNKVQIATGSYAGSGATSKSLTFDFAPKLLIVSDDNRNVGNSCGAIFVIHNGSVKCMALTSANTQTLSATVSGTTLTWTASAAATAVNVSGRTAQYVAIG